MTAPARFTVMYKIVANFCRDHDFIALFRECLRDQLFAQSVSVRVGRIKQRDAEIERLVHQPGRFPLGEIPPPPGRNSPESEPNLAHRQLSVLVSAIAHCSNRKLPTRSPQHPNSEGTN